MITRALCAVCFLMFSFLWLYWFQADLLAVAQHSLSGGVTHYERTIGATIITIVLFLLQLAVHGITRLSRRTHALTYTPSFLALSLLSDINITPDNDVEVGRLWWVVAIVFLLWIGAVWVVRHALPFNAHEKQTKGLFSSRSWVNLILMSVMMLFVAAVGNTHAVLHFRAHAETALLHGDNREAIRVGWESLETDRQLTMLRAFALSREGLLGEKLFCYPVTGTGSDLLPMCQSPLILPADSIWRHLGGKPAFPMNDQLFYHLLEFDSLATPAVADYALCGKLIDCDLLGFVNLLPRYYDTNASLRRLAGVDKHSLEGTRAPLPRHYCEALVLFAHLNPNSGLVYHNEPLNQEFQQLLQLIAQHPEDSEWKIQMMEAYRDTYWYYYKMKTGK